MQHAVRLTVPLTGQSFRQGQLTELPVSLMIARDSGGSHGFNSPSGLREALQRLAGTIDETQADSAMCYLIEYPSVPVKGRKPSTSEVRVIRDGVTIAVIAAQ